MKYRDLRDFIEQLEQRGELKRIRVEVDPYLEITEICDRTLRAGGPALLFENPKGSDIPLLGNLFGTPKRVALGMGEESVDALREVGRLLAFLKEPDPPKGMKDAWQKLPVFKKVLDMAPKERRGAPCQEVVLEGDDVDLARLPIQTCWPGDAGRLITWGLVVTRGPDKPRQNLGIYRMQVLGRNRVIMRWLAHRGGALDFREWQQKHPGEPFPVSVALGADPATILAAVTPVPDTLSEYAFAGLLRGSRTEVARCYRQRSAGPGECGARARRPYPPRRHGRRRPVRRPYRLLQRGGQLPGLHHRTHHQRRDPIYHSTYTGRPPDEPAILGVALNEVFVPILQKQFPEIVDFYLPPEGCSYRLAVVSMKKQYPGHAKRVMMGVWSFLRQFMYTKFVIVVDEDVNTRDWKDVIWAMTTRMDPVRDTVMVENTPIDYLDFASPVSGLGSKIGFDATNKWQGETQREWGRPIRMDEQIKQRVDGLWGRLGID